MPAHCLGETAFRTEQAAPGAADQNHAEENEGPPNAPEAELREKRQIAPDMRRATRQGQEGRNRDEKQIESDDRPLQALYERLMAFEPMTERGNRSINPRGQRSAAPDFHVPWHRKGLAGGIGSGASGQSTRAPCQSLACCFTDEDTSFASYSWPILGLSHLIRFHRLRCSFISQTR